MNPPGDVIPSAARDLLFVYLQVCKSTCVPRSEARVTASRTLPRLGIAIRPSHPGLAGFTSPRQITQVGKPAWRAAVIRARHNSAIVEP